MVSSVLDFDPQSFVEELASVCHGLLYPMVKYRDIIDSCYRKSQQLISKYHGNLHDEYVSTLQEVFVFLVDSKDRFEAQASVSVLQAWLDLQAVKKLTEGEQEIIDLLRPMLVELNILDTGWRLGQE